MPLFPLELDLKLLEKIMFTLPQISLSYKQALVDPLGVLSKQPPKYTSLSMVNQEVGICPKCQQQMGTATIFNGDTVFYCEKCRVSEPLPNDVGS